MQVLLPSVPSFVQWLTKIPLKWCNITAATMQLSPCTAPIFKPSIWRDLHTCKDSWLNCSVTHTLTIWMQYKARCHSWKKEHSSSSAIQDTCVWKPGQTGGSLLDRLVHCACWDPRWRMGEQVIEMLRLRLCFEVSECVTAMLPASNLRWVSADVCCAMTVFEMAVT